MLTNLRVWKYSLHAEGIRADIKDTRNLSETLQPSGCTIRFMLSDHVLRDLSSLHVVWSARFGKAVSTYIDRSSHQTQLGASMRGAL